MAMSIEFLYAKEDIPDLVYFLYANDCYISHRNSCKCNDILPQNRAINALISDLCTPFGTYYIGRKNNTRLLLFDSCGRQGHPRHLGKRGRYAGKIVCDDRTHCDANDLYKLIKNYFKKNYSYQRYNGNARMSCYFAPNYLNFEKMYAQNPDPEGMCPGYLRIICASSQKQNYDKIIESIFSDNAFDKIFIEWHRYWEDDELLELQIDFLYNSEKIDYEAFQCLSNKIVDKEYLTNMINNKLHMAAGVHTQLGMIKRNICINMSLVMEHAWLGNVSAMYQDA